MGRHPMNLDDLPDAWRPALAEPLPPVVTSGEHLTGWCAHCGEVIRCQTLGHDDRGHWWHVRTDDRICQP